jgi:tetratricopeptide (TPR) repeat protein
MSTDSVEAEPAADMCCASCGIAGVDDIKLKECDACDLVHYCSDECKQDHSPKHEHLCKERAAELREELLFRQPESTHLGDCPICCLPLSINGKRCAVMSCCSKWICDGCNHANGVRHLRENLRQTCPFCRHPTPKNVEEGSKNFMKRAAANDPEAMNQMGFTREKEGDYDSAFEYLSKAAELGDALAHWSLSLSYAKGKGVEKDEKKEIYHLEEASIAGHPDARIALGTFELKSKRYDRAVKHWIIAANLGYDQSIQVLKECYKGGLVSKEEFAAALRAHQAAVDATKSPQREVAAEYLRFKLTQQGRK